MTTPPKENKEKRMVAMNSLCQTVVRFLDADTPLVLVTMMDQKGSVPRAAGARMLVLPDGGIRGTVGGGRYEAEAIATALDLHKQGEAEGRALAPPVEGAARPGAVLDYSLRGVTDMDMICGGALTMLLEYLPVSEPVREVFRAGSQAERVGESFVLLARFTRSGGQSNVAGREGEGPLARDGAGLREDVRVERFAWRPARAELTPGDAALPEDILAEASALSGDKPHHASRGSAEYLLEFFPRPFRLVIFGGGHVSREVARLANAVEFHTTVVDDRLEFANEERFPGSAVVLATSLDETDSAALLQSMDIGPSDGLVIVTRGHSYDRDVLAAALTTRAGYIGMIGSKAKRAAVYANLREKGVSQERLDQVYSPIGLAIGAETPAEIAVSIVGELIFWRKTVRGRV